MIVSDPVWTWGTLPDTGASSIAAPRAFTRSATARLAWGLTVLMSTQSFPAPRPARIPSGPDATLSSTPSSGTEVKTTSAASATSRGVSRQPSPWSTRPCACSRWRASPKTVYPAARNRAAIFPPMCPSPTNPSMVIGFSLRSVGERSGARQERAACKREDRSSGDRADEGGDACDQKPGEAPAAGRVLELEPAQGEERHVGRRERERPEARAEAQGAVERQESELRDDHERRVTGQSEEQQVGRPRVDEEVGVAGDCRRCELDRHGRDQLRRKGRPEEQPVERHGSDENQRDRSDAEEELRDAVEPDRRGGICADEADPNAGEDESRPSGRLVEPAREPLTGEQAADEESGDERCDHDGARQARGVWGEHASGEHERGEHRGDEEGPDGRIARVAEDPSRSLPEIRDGEDGQDCRGDDSECFADLWRPGKGRRRERPEACKSGKPERHPEEGRRDPDRGRHATRPS